MRPRSDWLWCRLKTASSLGLGPVARALGYKWAIRAGVHPVCHLEARVADGVFFRPVPPGNGRGALPLQPHQGETRLFGWVPLPLAAEPPDWHENVLSGGRMSGAAEAWWRIPDFDPSIGDIKGVWEVSRFAWVVPFAQRALSGDRSAGDYLNDWIRDWCDRNPPYRGANWKCAQEASIRLLHLAVAAVILDAWKDPGEALTSLVRVHLQRIEATISYGVAQDNNHGVSEAAALFVGGSWLRAAGLKSGGRWERLGRKWLENRVRRLIAPDGTFSQYSVNYHRMVLDTLAITEVWRARTGQAPFSNDFVARARAATIWLFTLVDAASGDAPNLGANDGAWLLSLTDAAYRDYRPTVQLAAALFLDACAYESPGSWNTALEWLGVPPGVSSLATPSSAQFDDGGIAVLSIGTATAVVRYPRFTFRPGHADALHVDLRIDGQNHLRDGGSFLYSCDDGWHEYFAGTASHNTVEFDGRDQMPRLGRFLFGEWLSSMDIEPVTIERDQVSFAAGYQDYTRARHSRRTILRRNLLTIEDRVSGFRSKAVLRWRLMPGEWRFDGDRVCNGALRLQVRSSGVDMRIALAEGWESRWYGVRTPLPVMEIEVNQPCCIWSTYEW